MILTERQRTILNAVTERYIGTGTPVSSKELAGTVGSAGLVVHGAQRVRPARGEGLPHPSAHLRGPGAHRPGLPGVRRLSHERRARSSGAPRVRAGAGEAMLPEDLAGEIDTALRQATDAMSRATNLLALVLAPRVSGARLCHVELLRSAARSAHVRVHRVHRRGDEGRDRLAAGHRPRPGGVGPHLSQRDASTIRPSPPG